MCRFKMCAPGRPQLALDVTSVDSSAVSGLFFVRDVICTYMPYIGVFEFLSFMSRTSLPSNVTSCEGGPVGNSFRGGFTGEKHLFFEKKIRGCQNRFFQCFLGPNSLHLL